jgi:hypothetical protein
MVATMFCQLAQAKSLREISDGLACCEDKLNHLGLQTVFVVETEGDERNLRTESPQIASRDPHRSEANPHHGPRFRPTAAANFR